MVVADDPWAFWPLGPLDGEELHPHDPHEERPKPRRGTYIAFDRSERTDGR